MDRNDDKIEASLRYLLGMLDDQAEAESAPYVEVLMQLEQLIPQLLAAASTVPDAPGGEISPAATAPEQEQAARDALGRTEPRADDQRQAYPVILERVLVVVERELHRWTSSMVQPPGLTGTVAMREVPMPEDAPVRRR